MRYRTPGRIAALRELHVNPFDLTLTDVNHPFHVHHVEKCLEEARIAADEDEVPIGARWFTRSWGSLVKRTTCGSS